MSDLTRDEFIDALKENKKDFEHLDFEGMDLRGIDLQKVNLSGANLIGAKLSGNRLTEANLARADLTEAELSGCKLMSANLEAATLHKADLTDANLTGARLLRADLRSADLSRAICAEADLRGADLTRAKLTVVDFRLANLGRANLSGAMMRGALLRGADLREANLEGASGVEPQTASAGTIEVPRANPAATRQGLTPQATATHLPQSRTASMPASARTQSIKDPSVVAGGVARSVATQAPPRAAPKAKKYHPPLRHIPALVFTSSGWIRGQFHVPVMHGFLDFLNRMGELLKLTNVTLPHLKRELAFFGLRRDSAMMIIPDCEEDLLSLPVLTGSSETHQTSFLMATGSVSGTMTIEADLRISDYLNQGRWVVLRDCEVGSHAGPTGRGKVAKFPLLILNTASIIGTSDESLVSDE